MGNLAGTLVLGSIMCKHCGALIDTVDTERVITYYSECPQGECKKEVKVTQTQVLGQNVRNDC